MNSLTPAAALPVIAGFCAIWLTALFSRPGMTAGKKRGISALVAAVLGVVSVIISGQIVGIPADTVDLVSRVVVYVGVTLIAAQGFYAALKDPARALEQATSPGQPPEPYEPRHAEVEGDAL